MILDSVDFRIDFLLSLLIDFFDVLLNDFWIDFLDVLDDDLSTSLVASGDHQRALLSSKTPSSKPQSGIPLYFSKTLPVLEILSS